MTAHVRRIAHSKATSETGVAWVRELFLRPFIQLGPISPGLRTELLTGKASRLMPTFQKIKSFARELTRIIANELRSGLGFAVIRGNWRAEIKHFSYPHFQWLFGIYYIMT